MPAMRSGVIEAKQNDEGENIEMGEREKHTPPPNETYGNAEKCRVCFIQRICVR